MHGCILVKKDLPDAGEWAHHLQFWTCSLPFPLRSLKHKAIFPSHSFHFSEFQQRKSFLFPGLMGNISLVLFCWLVSLDEDSAMRPTLCGLLITSRYLIWYIILPQCNDNPLLICVCRFISRTQGADFTWQQRFNNICLTNYLYFILLQYLSKVRPLRLPFLELRLPHAPCPLCRQGPGLWRFHLHFIFTLPSKCKKLKRESWSRVSGGWILKKIIFHRYT